MMTIQVPGQPHRPTDFEDYVSPRDEIAMKRDREEWDNEGGAARLPAHAGAQVWVETRKLADILPPPIMANRRKGILRCAYND
jgi:hypothetical protein